MGDIFYLCYNYTMIQVAWVLSLIAAFSLGYSFRGFAKRVKAVEVAIAQKIDEPIEVEEESPSDIIDPYDEVAEAKYEMAQEMKRLNQIK